MDLQYIADAKGHKRAVQVPIKDWEKIRNDLEELKQLRNKKLFIAELSEVF